jgi:acyl-CoA synthetase (NDP forming)
MLEETLLRPRKVALVGDSKDEELAEEFLRIAERMAGLEDAKIIDLAGLASGSERSVNRLEKGTDLAIVAIRGAKLARHADLISKRCRLTVLLGQAPRPALEKIGRFIGPRSAGIINSRAGLRAMAVDLPPAGSVSLISRGRNVTFRILRKMALYSVGVSFAVCTGEGLGVPEVEILRAVATDRGTSVVCLSDGGAGMRGLLEEVSRVSTGKPVLFHPVDRDDRLLASAVRQKGGIVCRSIRELVCGAKILSEAPPLYGRRLLLLAQADDLCREVAKHLGGFEICEIPEKVAGKVSLHRSGPGYCFDDLESLRRRIRDVLDLVDGCLIVFELGEKEENIARFMEGIRAEKTLAFIHPGRWKPGRYPVFDDPEDAVAALRISEERGRQERRLAGTE